MNLPMKIYVKCILKIYGMKRSAEGLPGEGKINDFQAAFFKEILYRDRKTAGYAVSEPACLWNTYGDSVSATG